MMRSPRAPESCRSQAARRTVQCAQRTRLGIKGCGGQQVRKDGDQTTGGGSSCSSNRPSRSRARNDQPDQLPQAQRKIAASVSGRDLSESNIQCVLHQRVLQTSCSRLLMNWSMRRNVRIKTGLSMSETSQKTTEHHDSIATCLTVSTCDFRRLSTVHFDGQTGRFVTDSVAKKPMLSVPSQVSLIWPQFLVSR